MYGVVPPASALAGPSGYLGNGATRQQEEQEEWTGLLRDRTPAHPPSRLQNVFSISSPEPGAPSVHSPRGRPGMARPLPTAAAPLSRAASISGMDADNPRLLHTLPSLQRVASLSPAGSGSPRASWGGGEGGPMPRASDAGSRARLSQQHQQAAAAGQYSYESLDYELVDNVVYRADEASRTHFDVIVRGGVKWLLCFLVGVITAGAAIGVNFSVENISGYKFWVTLTLLDQGYVLPSFLLYLLINCSLVGAAVAVTVYWAPAAAGSGIAEVKAYLNGIDVPGIFLVSTLVAKMLGSIGAVAAGLAVGKEGPFVHAGAAIGALLSQGGSSSLHIPWFRRFWFDRDRADMVACGAAAGVAAAFRSPLGGVLFALEEMTTWWRNQLLWYVFFTTAVVSVAVRVMMKFCAAETSCGFFGSGGFIVYEIREGQDGFEVYELLPMVLIGVIGGLAGATFNALNAKLARLRKLLLLTYGPKGRVVEGVVVAALTSTVSFVLPMLVACVGCPPDSTDVCPRRDNSHSGNFVGFSCATSSEYNDLATLFFNTQDDAIRALFSSKTKDEYSVGTLLTFVVVFYLLAVLTYGVSVPTGLFVPSILCGAAYGRLVGVFVADLHPSINIDEGTYALLGAASFLGGCMRMTVCTCVMLVELTNNLTLLPLVMLVLLVAKAVGDGTGMKPVYDSLIEVKDLPYLDPDPEPLMRHITAAEAAGRPPVTFQRVERVAVLLSVLQSTRHNGFPVTALGADGEPYILGVVLRSQLLVLLQTKRCFQPSPFVSELSARVAFSYEQSEFLSPISEPPPDAFELSLSMQQQDMYIDLGPYVNPSYYVVQEDASLSKVYTLFRTLGLRHLCVIPRAPEVVGIITRNDLQQQRLQRRFLHDVPMGAGVSGLASHLRGTVWRAMDAFSNQPASSTGGGGGGVGASSSSRLSETNGSMSRYQQQQQQQRGASTSRSDGLSDAAYQQQQVRMQQRRVPVRAVLSKKAANNSFSYQTTGPER